MKTFKELINKGPINEGVLKGKEPYKFPELMKIFAKSYSKEDVKQVKYAVYNGYDTQQKHHIYGIVTNNDDTGEGFIMDKLYVFLGQKGDIESEFGGMGKEFDDETKALRAARGL